MNKVYLLIGGNMGNRKRNLGRAIVLLNEYCGKVVKASSIYQTAAWGITNQPAFLNQALLLETPAGATALLTALLDTEEKMGRRRAEKYGPRNIDIDLLLYNNEVINLPQLMVPHPEMQRRRFALVPLAEIAADIVHPVYHKTIATLLAECPDDGDVKKI
jgi:2-amino-4-hydroxy-6-hydroxymethyldihydropteridine diphosphokinase